MLHVLELLRRNGNLGATSPLYKLNFGSREETMCILVESQPNE